MVRQDGNATYLGFIYVLLSLVAYNVLVVLAVKLLEFCLYESQFGSHAIHGTQYMYPDVKIMLALDYTNKKNA